MLEANRKQELVRGVTSKCFEYPAEMKRTNQAVPGDLNKGYVLCEMCGDIMAGLFNSGEMVFFQPGINAVVRLVIGDRIQCSPDHFHDKVVYLEFGSRSLGDQVADMSMQEVEFGIGTNKGRMEVPVLEKFGITIPLRKFRCKFIGKIKDRTLVRYGVDMGNGTFESGFGDQHTPCVGIK